VTEPVDLRLTEPNAAGRQYRHGTLTGYNPGVSNCDHCRGAYATYLRRRNFRNARRTYGHARQAHRDARGRQAQRRSA
jgi:hypothetical protein